MISLPIVPESLVLSDVFPGAVVVYSYERNVGYVRVQEGHELKRGKGYWILLDQNQNYNLTGQPIQSYTLPVSENGWEMIGGCTLDAQASVENGIIKVIYHYKQGSGYQRVLESEHIKPSQGYWILFEDVTDQCELTVEATDSDIH